MEKTDRVVSGLSCVVTMDNVYPNPSKSLAKLPVMALMPLVVLMNMEA